MRTSRLVILLATMASVLHADGGLVVELPRVDESMWKPQASQSGVFSQGELADLHKNGYTALSDPSLPFENGVSSYVKMVGILSGSHDIESARSAYMDLVRELAFFSVSRNCELATDEILDGAASLARTDAEKSLVHFLYAWRLADSKVSERRARAGGEFEQATAIESPQLREQMLLRYLKWAQTDGISEISESGELKTGADYEKAILICEKIAASAQSRDVINYAVDCVKRIQSPSVELDVANAFRTGSQAQFAVNWRNCEAVEVSIYSLKMDQIPISGDATSLKNIASSIVLPDETEPVRRLTMNTAATHKYYQVKETARMDDLLMPGAYLVRVACGDYHAEDMLFITDSILAVKVGKSKILSFACNAQTGKPIPNTEITLWSRLNSTSGWVRSQKTSGSDGVAVFSGKDVGGPDDATQSDYVAILTKDQQQSVSTYSSENNAYPETASWSARIFTDSDDYMPGNKLGIVALVRRNSDGRADVVVGEEIRLELSGPDGFKPITTIVKVDKYGIADTNLVLPDGMPDGTYKVTANRLQNGLRIGSPRYISIHGNYTPDYKVAVKFDNAGESEAFIIGSLLKGVIHVTAPYGGPVSGQPLEILIEERPYDLKEGRGSGDWKNVSRTQTRTNSRGEAPFAYQTRISGQNDFEFRVKALVADSDDSPSIASASILATRQWFYADMRTDALLYEQGKGVKLQLTTKSANGAPIVCKGVMRLSRESWKEVWTDRRGHELSGAEMQELRKRGGGWFGLGQNAGDYVLKSQGYTTEVLLDEPLDTNSQGVAYYVWDDAQPGYYRFSWLGENGSTAVVSCEHAFWVSGKDSGIVGYRPDRIRLVSNPSETGSDLTMITVPATNQSVLVTVGSKDIESWSLVDLKGTAQALETKAASGFPTEYLNAFCVNEENVDSAITLLRKPAPEGLKVSVSNDRTDYEPGESASFIVTVSDAKGLPVKDARVFFWITGAANDAPMPDVELFPSAPSKYGVHTVTSINVKPFFRPKAHGELITPANTSSRDSESESTASDDNLPDIDEIPTASTAVWLTDGLSDKNGNVLFEVKMPRTISLWSVEAVASHENGAAGVSRVYATTNEPLGTSLNAPESIFAGDIVNICATVANNQADETHALINMHSLGASTRSPSFSPLYVNFEPYSVESANWRMSFEDAGLAQFIVSAKTSDKVVKFATDVFVKPNPSYRTYSASTFSSGSDIVLPEIAANSRLKSLEYYVSASPSSVALGALRSLLTDKSRGSTEVAARAATICSLRRLLERMHYSNASIDDGMTRSGVLAYNKTRLSQDLDILRSTQALNGSWGWIDSANPDCFATAYNLIMLNLCDGEVAEKLAPAVAKARAYAASELVAEDQPADLRAMLLFGLASRELGQTRPSRLEARSLVNLMRVQGELGPFALACLALSAKQYGFDDEAAEIATLIRSKAVFGDDAHGGVTAHWKSADITGSLPASEVESTAMSVLALLSASGPKDSLIEQSVRFIFENSHDGHWDGPRETSLCILAMRDLSAFSAETDLDAKCAIVADGKNIGEYDLSTDTTSGPPIWRTVPCDIQNAPRSIDIRRISGESPVFGTLRAVYDCGIVSTNRSSIPGLTLTRKYFKAVLVPTLLSGPDERVAQMDAKETASVGDRLDALITIDVDHVVPTLILEQERPAFASWHNQTASPTVTCISDNEKKPARMQISYSDSSLVISFEQLPAGKWEIRYPVRIDYAGEFTVPSAKAWIPQRGSMSAESDMLRVKCVSGQTSETGAGK